jgi:hypothetical protein
MPEFFFSEFFFSLIRGRRLLSPPEDLKQQLVIGKQDHHREKITLWDRLIRGTAVSHTEGHRNDGIDRV